jgi:hypothetical protein
MDDGRIVARGEGLMWIRGRGVQRFAIATGVAVFGRGAVPDTAGEPSVPLSNLCAMRRFASSPVGFPDIEVTGHHVYNQSPLTFTYFNN